MPVTPPSIPSIEFFYEEKFQNCDDYVCPMILPGSSEKRRNIEQYLVDNNINYSVEIEIPNSTLLKKLIINDMGIGYINKKFIEDEVENGLVVVIESFKNMRKSQKKEFTDLILKEMMANYELTIEEDITHDKKNINNLSEEEIEFLIKRELKLQRIEQMFKGVVDLTELAELVCEDDTYE